MNILIGSCIKEEPRILQEFLTSIEELEKGYFTFDYMFIDDGNEYDSQQILKTFESNHANNILMKSTSVIEKRKDEITHYWNERIIWRIAELKNMILRHAQINGFDYVFLLDSDLVLHPKTLIKLIERNKNIISEIFWTKWKPDSIELPQVWLSDQYNLFNKSRTEVIDDKEINKRINDFLTMLREPGIYRVGGLGACTLIDKKALDAGVSFNEIYNLSFWGEDRHFCIRAAAMGFELYVDTCYPAFHIYRNEDLTRVENYKASCKTV